MIQIIQETIVEEEKIQDFFVKKNGEYVIIKHPKNPKNYFSRLVVDKETSSGTFNDAAMNLKTYLISIISTGFFRI